MFMSLLAAVMLAPPTPPAPKTPINKAQPQGYTPYKHPDAKVDSRYYLNHGHKFKHGYYYEGYQHPHWEHYYWDKRYGTYLYFDSGVKTWYYWCAPHYRYYPVTYLPEDCKYDIEYQRIPKRPNKVPHPPK